MLIAAVGAQTHSQGLDLAVLIGPAPAGADAFSVDEDAVLDIVARVVCWRTTATLMAI